LEISIGIDNRLGEPDCDRDTGYRHGSVPEASVAASVGRCDRTHVWAGTTTSEVPSSEAGVDLRRFEGRIPRRDGLKWQGTPSCLHREH
jgi:hypothetical protein